MKKELLFAYELSKININEVVDFTYEKDRDEEFVDYSKTFITNLDGNENLKNTGKGIFNPIKIPFRLKLNELYKNKTIEIDKLKIEINELKELIIFN